ncbi:MAG: hypothetical protein AB1775_13135 [Bacteroidota bacterium]
MKFILFISIVILLFTSACDTSTAPVDEIPGVTTDEYMSLNVGDIRQFYMPYADNNMVHTVWKVTGKTFRSDSTEVFVNEWYTAIYSSYSKRVEYGFIRDGFYYYTELEKTSKIPGNPYFEQALAKIKPQDGDKWLQTAGILGSRVPPDTLTSKYLDKLETPAVVFHDVFSYTGPGGEKTYYAKYFGYLGISFSSDKRDLFIVNYMKINGREIGKYVKMDSLLKSSNNTFFKNKQFSNPLGVRNKW